MMYIAFHYRLPGDPIDPKAEKPGSWKAFPDKLQANAWIGRRKQKTKTSPQGGWICTATTLSMLKESEVQAWATMYDGEKVGPCPASLKRAIVAYLRYKSLPA